MVDVLIYGGGFVARALASGLTRAGASVHRVDDLDRAPVPAVALPIHPEPPARFLYALGADRGQEVVAFAAAGLARTPGFSPVGADWLTDDPADLDACRALGVAADPVDGGLRLTGAGIVTPSGAPEGSVGPEPVPAEVTIVATGRVPPTLTAWFDDVLMPVRWQRVAWPGIAGPAVPRISRFGSVIATGPTLCVTGAQWAEPHLGVGDRDPVTTPAVLGRLRALAAQDHSADPAASDAGAASITWASCDGLPVVGPLPGRARLIACVGFGAAVHTYGQAAADALIDGLTGRDGLAAPACFSSRRLLSR